MKISSPRKKNTIYKKTDIQNLESFEKSKSPYLQNSEHKQTVNDEKNPRRNRSQFMEKNVPTPTITVIVGMKNVFGVFIVAQYYCSQWALYYYTYSHQKLHAISLPSKKK